MNAKAPASAAPSSSQKLATITAYLAQSPGRLFLFALAWGAYLALFGLIPGILRDASLVSITFDLRDYLLRAFVVFMVAHLIARQTTLLLLAAIPPATFILWQAIDVYDFSEWYSQNYRVNLHELNAQLFVVPIQVAIAIAGLCLCLKRSTKTTSRVFATIMIWGSLISTLMFHLSIVEVSYKPVETVFADMLERTATADDYAATCKTMRSACAASPVDQAKFEEAWALDPQLRIHLPYALRILAIDHMWVTRDADGVMHAGLASVNGKQIRYSEDPLPVSLTMPMERYALDGATCPAGAVCHGDMAAMKASASSRLLATIDTAAQTEFFAHAWIEGMEGEDAGLWLRILGKVDDQFRLVSTPLDAHTPIFPSHTSSDCDGSRCKSAEAESLSVSTGISPGLRDLARTVAAGTYQPLYLPWVDKALSRNPVKYIDRPEFLRALTYRDGQMRMTTTPPSFSSITLDMKVTFNLIITAFSTSWLILGVYLILYHTRRALASGRAI